MQSGACQPGSDREFTVSENAHGSTNTQAFGQRAENFPDATRRGFEAVQDRAVADAELCLAGLALEISDVFMAAVATTTDKGVNLVIGNVVVQAVGVGTGVPSRHDAFLAATRAFDLGIWFQRCRD